MAENVLTVEHLSICLLYTSSPSFDADILDAISIEACVAGRNNYSGTAPECVERQRNNGKQIIANEEAQIDSWKSIVNSVQE